MLTQEEILLAGTCMRLALENGADKVRITLNKSLMELYGMLNGTLDKVSRALDRSLTVQLFADGRYGSFSSNRLGEEELRQFILKSIETVRMLAPDPARDLPDPERTSREAQTGMELELYDAACERLSAADRRDMAGRSSLWPRKAAVEQGFSLLSEEGEYSDTRFDSLLVDSNGVRCRHRETSFEIGYEVTIEDPEGHKYSGYWWDAAPRLGDLRIADCSEQAIRRAAAQMHPKPHPGGKLNLVVDSECASKLLNPVLSALNALSIQQNNSFLAGKIGEKVFPECLTVMDLPHEKGATGSRLYDSEGVATSVHPIIERGVIKEYFVNTCMANKMGLAPTVEDATRPKVMPAGDCRTREDVLRKAGSGIFVTGFNGGNSNSSTGDFSYGIEGFAFEDGALTHPVHEMLITGNFISLWNSLFAAAEDIRPCLSKLVPTLAFRAVNFSG